MSRIRIKIEEDGKSKSNVREQFDKEVNQIDDEIKIIQVLDTSKREWISEIIFPVREKWIKEIRNQGISEQIFNLFIERSDPFPPKVSRISENLYLGNVKASEDREFLKTIDKIIFVGDFNKPVELLKYYHEKGIEHIHIWLPDLENYHYPFEILKRHCKKNTKTLIHCRAGISRSVIAAIFFLIKTREVSDLIEACRLVKRMRPVASPNVGFLIQLVNWFEDLKAAESV